MILDTSFVIDFLNGKEDAVSKMQSFYEDNVDCAISSPTIFELWSGIASLEKGENKKNKTDSFLRSRVVYDLDSKSAERAGKIHGELIKKGLVIDPEDCMIAGIAMENNKKVLTKDSHFSRVDGLKIETY